MSGETCLPFSHYRYLWLSSWTAFASALYGSAMGHPYDVIATPANIFLTSMLYWEVLRGRLYNARHDSVCRLPRV